MSYAIHFAPLQGYTDRIYWEAHAQVFGGVEAYYTPFVRLEKDEFRKKELRDIASADNQIASLIPQLIAATPSEFGRIAMLFREQGYHRADINLGCPFPMQARLHRGAGLLPYKEEVAALLSMVHEFPDIRFSVKLRLGWSDNGEAEAYLPLLNSLPLEHITLHPRIGMQQYKGKVDMDGFSCFYAACNHPLFYNGDLNTLDDIRSLTDCYPRLRGVMLGRGLLAHPWLGAEYTASKEMSGADKREKLHVFHALLVENYSSRLEGGEHQLLARLKTIWDYLLPDAEKRLRKKVIKSSGLAAYNVAVKDLLACQ